MTTMESLIGLVNQIQKVCTMLGDYGGGDNPFSSLWEALPTIVVVGGQVPPLFSHFFCNFLEREREKEFWCRESLGVKEWFSIERIWVLLEREKKWKFSCLWERERERESVWDFKFVLDWKIYVICNFAHFRSRWIKTWEWYLNSHDLIIFIFYLSSVWLLRKVGRKENMQVSFNVLMFWVSFNVLMFWGKGELVLPKKNPQMICIVWVWNFFREFLSIWIL